MLFDFSAYKKYQHVEALFRLLAESAFHMRTMTYEAACKNLGINSKGHAIRYALGAVAQMCIHLQMPPLNVICVKTHTHRPGPWAYEANSESEWRANVAAVYLTPWMALLNHNEEK